METKTKMGDYKGHKILSIEGVGQNGKEYTILGAGAAKWARVVEHIDEIKAFVKEQTEARAAAADKTTKTAKADKTRTKKAKTPKVVF